MFLKDKKAMNFGKVLNQRGLAGFVVGLVAILVMLLGLIASVFLFSVQEVQAATLTVQPSAKDTYLDKLNPDGPSGAMTRLEIKNRSTAPMRVILEFNISELQPSATLNSASLQLYYYDWDYFDPVNRTVKAYKFTQTDWVELEATWNNAAGSYVTSNPAGGSTALPSSYGWMTWDVLAIVQDAYDSSNPAEFMVRYTAENLATGYMKAKFYSKEYTDDPDLQPKLVIDYTLPVVAPTVTTQAADPVGTTTATGNGNITNDGGENCDHRGIVYGKTSKGDPGDTAYDATDYDDFEDESGSFGIEAFTRSLTGLDEGTKYYVRAYAHNSEGYSYGDEVNFTTTFQYAFSGTLTSTNLLDGEIVSSIDSFFASTTQPAATALWAQFSQDSSDWYSAGGDLGATTTISTSTPNTDLSGLGWSGPNFYYKMFFSSDGTDTPILDEIQVDFTSWIPRPPGISPSGGGFMIF